MTADMRQALTERRDLIEARANVILDQALNDGENWTTALGRARDLSHDRETTRSCPHDEKRRAGALIQTLLRDAVSLVGVELDIHGRRAPPRGYLLSFGL